MKKEHKLLTLIFLLSLTFRLFFVLQTRTFSSDTAYYHIKHVAYITQNFLPLIYDPLSYGGRTIIDSHLFHYFLALFNLILPQGLAFKIIPPILLSSVVFIVYGIAAHISNNKNAALLAATMSAILPIYIQQTLNQISIYSIVIPLIFYAVYCFLSIEKNLTIFIVLSFILPVIHPIAFLLSLAFVIYLILLSLDGLTPLKLRKEAIIFSVFLTSLISFVIYKKALLAMGLTAVWKSLPTELLANYFTQIDPIEIIYGLSLLPLLMGSLGFILGVFREKERPKYFLGSLTLAVFFLLILKLIDFHMGVVFFGLFLCIMSAITFEKITHYMQITKFAKYTNIFTYFMFTLVIVSLVTPAITNTKEIMGKSISQEDMDALNWLKESTPQISVVLADINEGNLISGIAERRNVADTSFLLAPRRYPDVTEIFTTPSVVKATKLLHKYGVDYIYLSETAKRDYKIQKLIYTTDENCFKEAYKNAKVQIYEILC